MLVEVFKIFLQNAHRTVQAPDLFSQNLSQPCLFDALVFMLGNSFKKSTKQKARTGVGFVTQIC
jgi:hypothetical protein